MLAAAQAQHGSTPDIAGRDRANPTSLILSGAMLLDWHGEKRNLGRYREAAAADATLVDPTKRTADLGGPLDATLVDPTKRTADLGGPLGTKAFAAAVLEHLDSPPGATDIS